MTLSPFYMGNDVEPETEDGYVINENWGVQLAFMAVSYTHLRAHET